MEMQGLYNNKKKMRYKFLYLDESAASENVYILYTDIQKLN